MAIAQTIPIIYLLSGQGSDQRIFQELPWDSSKYDIEYISYPVPLKREGLTAYAHRLSEKIDTSRRYMLIGVSMGGMIASEINAILQPESVIIISSAKCRNELPRRYRIQKSIPVYQLVPKALIKSGAQVAQPIVEPDRKSHKAIFQSMLKAKNKTFMKRSIQMITGWEKECAPSDSNIVHIHGTNDHTLPYRLISDAVKLDGGSHMMTLTSAAQVFQLMQPTIDAMLSAEH